MAIDFILQLITLFIKGFAIKKGQFYTVKKNLFLQKNSGSCGCQNNIAKKKKIQQSVNHSTEQTVNLIF